MFAIDRVEHSQKNLAENSSNRPAIVFEFFRWASVLYRSDRFVKPSRNVQHQIADLLRGNSVLYHRISTTLVAIAIPRYASGFQRKAFTCLPANRSQSSAIRGRALLLLHKFSRYLP